MLIRRKWIHIISKVIAGRYLLTACILSALTAHPRSVIAETASRPDLQLLVSIHWEGLKISKSSIAALKELKRNFPSLQIVHLLNAGYFTRSQPLPEDTLAEIKKILRPEDFIGIHFNPFSSLVEKAGVNYRKAPTFWGNDEGSISCPIDCGHEVSTSAYPAAELSKLVRTAKSVIEENLDRSPVFFHAAGWAFSNSQLSVLRENGLEVDLSSVDKSALKKSLGPYPLYQLIPEIEENQGSGQSVFVSSEQPEVIRIRNHLGYASYHSRKSLKDRFVSFMSNNTDLVPVWVLAMSQENAAVDAQILTQAIWDIQKFSFDNKLKMANFSLKSMMDFYKTKLAKTSSTAQMLSGLFSSEKQPSFDQSESKPNSEHKANTNKPGTSEKLQRLAKDFYSKMLEYSR